MISTAGQKQLVSTLARRLDGVVRTDLAAIQGAATDFGQVIVKTPTVVVWPDHADDVATVLHCAQAAGCPVSIRGTGHSQGGQSLNQGGIVIDTRSLDPIEQINKAEGWVIAGAGGLWSTLVRVVAAAGVLPPVLTDHTQVTIGGTLAIGGVGPASFRQGLQIDHCLGLEVVLGTGEVLWISPQHEPDLFHHVLGGLGQFGVITKAKVRLRPFQRYTQTIRLVYHKLTTFLQGAQFFGQQPNVHWLEGFARPRGGGLKPLTGAGHHYILEVSTESNDLTLIDGQRLWEDANAEGGHTVVKRTTLDYVFRLEQVFAGYGRPVEKSRARPWVEHFLPLSAVEEYVETIAASFPATTFLLWPMPTSLATSLPVVKSPHPMVAMPSVSPVVLVGIMASIPPAQLEAALPRLQQASALGITLGGKRYLSGWVNFDQQQWRQHYGGAQRDQLWDHRQQLKQRCDPQQVLQSLCD